MISPEKMIRINLIPDERSRLKGKERVFQKKKDTLEQNSHIQGTFRVLSERFFAKHFKGKRFEDEKGENQEQEKTLRSLGKKITLGTLDLGAKICGMKFAWDGLRFATQSYFTKKEREELFEKYRRYHQDRKDYEAGNTLVQEAMRNKRVEFEKKVEDSAFMTQAQKEFLFHALEDLHEKSKQDKKRDEVWESKQREKIFQKTIRTRIELVTVLKEAINSAMMVSNLFTLRMVGYGAFSLVEKYRQVNDEFDLKQKEGLERSKLQIKKWVLEGFKETRKKLRFVKEKMGREKRPFKKTVRLGKAVSFLLFTSSLAGAGYQEYQEHDSSGFSQTWQDSTDLHLDELLQSWEEKSTMDVLKEKGEKRLDRITLGLRKEKRDKSKLSEEQKEQDATSKVHLAIGDFHFSHDIQGNVLSLVSEQPLVFSPQDKLELHTLLLPQWQDVSFAKSLPIHEQTPWKEQIEQEASFCYVYLLLLEDLQKRGFHESREALYLTNTLKESLQILEERYGKIFSLHHPRFQKSIPSLAQTPE
jgi:hypothetical protein